MMAKEDRQEYPCRNCIYAMLCGSKSRRTPCANQLPIRKKVKKSCGVSPSASDTGCV